jgi:hypothetical protein
VQSRSSSPFKFRAGKQPYSINTPLTTINFRIRANPAFQKTLINTVDVYVFYFQSTFNFPRWTSRWTPLDVKHVSYCHVKPFRRVRKNGKAWIPKHSITTICLPISPAEHPTYIKDESGRRRSTPLDVKIPPAGRQLDSPHSFGSGVSVT